MLTTVIHIGTLILEAIFGVFSAYVAYSLFAWTPPALAKAREALLLPRWFWLLAGTVATLGAAGLFVGLVAPAVGAVAAFWMVAYFIVASLTHLLRNDARNIAPALVFLVVAIGLAALRWGDLAPIIMPTH